MLNLPELIQKNENKRNEIRRIFRFTLKRLDNFVFSAINDACIEKEHAFRDWKKVSDLMFWASSDFFTSLAKKAKK